MIGFKRLSPPRSLQGRLVLLVLSTVLGVWLVAAVATWRDMRHELDELLDGHLAQAAALLVVQQGRGLDEHVQHPDAPSLHRYAPKVAFQVWHDGRLVMRSANAPAAPMGPTAPLPDDTASDDEDGLEGDDGRAARLDEGHLRSGFRTLTLEGVTWRVFATHGAEGDVQVYVGERVSSRASILLALMRSMLWPIAVALPLLGLAAWWGIRQGVAPLRTLGQLLRTREPRTLSPIALADTPHEMTPMLKALNDLLARIQALLDSERRFTGDAAHELRTPIAAIRAQAQVALAEVDDERRRHALRATVRGCDRATRLVEQLLTLSRLDAQAAPAMATVDLHALAAQAVADVAPTAVARHQTIELVGDAPCPVRGNDTLLAVLIRNLVDNAVRYSPAGARVRVSVGARAGTCAGVAAPARLVVEDSGPGLGPADRQRLGERFFRVLGTGESGSGLGWSIVARIAEVHGATVRVDTSTVLGGLRVTLDGPPPA